MCVCVGRGGGVLCGLCVHLCMHFLSIIMGLCACECVCAWCVCVCMVCVCVHGVCVCECVCV